ncbi:MAG: 50S ribosomal protein L3 [Verrucomicrobia bacterium]|nr:50S ribosomal protein L3 [Verrucomicrobiota bacterium]NBU68205.1 50S ribosomal protein L3 [Verrucomicrobiota bacterium]NDB99799.1 50S ribosomal protein L3 [Verrucomicrobiota bacterium]NDF16339.1 50S ribosomal protein L3 [Verrucomicrobiota bacterium]
MIERFGMIGKKVGMTRVYDDQGQATAVTVISAETNTVYEVRTPEKNGVRAVVLGSGERKASRTNKAQRVAFEKLGRKNPLVLRQFRAAPADLSVGAEVSLTRFKAGQLVDVLGVSKGKGFHGVMRKHNYAGQADAHGSTTHRRNGAIGCRSTPGRVYKNAGMPGTFGGDNCTVQNLRIVQVRESDKLLLVRGAVPGPNGSLVIVRDAIKAEVKA